MKMTHSISSLFSSISLMVVFFFASCANTKNVVYFSDITDTTSRYNSIIPEVVVQPNDILSISVSSINPEAAGIFNVPPTGNEPQTSGYLVDRDGFIQFPVLGRIKASGLTKSQLRDNITRTLLDKKLLVDPIVNIQYVNFKVVVLGEVGRPGVFNVPSEKINILEAVSMAGDLTIYGKRENVLLIREENNGQKMVKRINLNSKETLRLPYYYLKSNDILYVEPNKSRIASTDRTTTQILPLVFSAFSAVVTIVYLVLNNN